MRPDDYYVSVVDGNVTLNCPLHGCGWSSWYEFWPSMWTLNQDARSHIIEEHDD